MFESKLLRKPDYDLRWFWDAVAKFNAIANPIGVKASNQENIILSELKEVLDSHDENSFMDGVIDALVTIAPMVERDDFVLYWDDHYNSGLPYHDLKSSIDVAIEDQIFLYQGLVEQLLIVLVSDLFWYEYNCDSVLKSNLSKFIPVEKYVDAHWAQVEAAYPGVNVARHTRSYEGQKYVMFFNADTGKILKGHSHYFDPQLQIG